MTRLVFHLQSADEVPAGWGWLAPPEHETADALRVPKRRAEWLLGRYTIKRTLQLAGLAEPPERIEVRAAESGAPEPWVEGWKLPVSLSLSHSEGRALCVVGPPVVALGCDIETIAQRSEAFLSDYFTDEEQEFVARCKEAEAPLAATLVWSGKESVLKALQEGLRLPPRSITVVPGPECGVWSPLSVAGTPDREAYAGFWRRHGRAVLTVVAPAPQKVPVPACWTDEDEPLV